jgi:hypothetical protein
MVLKAQQSYGMYEAACCCKGAASVQDHRMGSKSVHAQQDHTCCAGEAEDFGLHTPASKPSTK